MQLHSPELYEAHRLRSREQLERLAADLMGCSYEEAIERNWTMPRGRPAKPTQAQQLIEALDFISVATNDNQDYQAYARLQGNMAIAYNGQMSAGHPIAEELTLCPRLDKFRTALQRCGKTLVIGETDNTQISVKGDKLRALVAAMKAEDLPPVTPDAPLVVIGDILKEAFKVCGTLASEAGQRVIEASLLLEANTCTGTNGAAMLQFWHGVDLPPMMVLPKIFTASVAKQSKPLTGFGFSWGDDGKVKTVTFWFEGGCWIKSQCYADSWPDISKVLDVQTFPSETITGLFEAIEAVSHFNDDGFVKFTEGAVMSHDNDKTGAQFEVKGLQAGKKFNGKLIKLVAPFAKQIDLTTFPDKAYFFGGETNNPIRGAIMGLSITTIERQPVEPDAPGAVNQVQEIDNDEPENTGWN